MIIKIEHLGIAVENAGKAVSTFEKLLGRPVSKTEDVVSENVRTHFFTVGESQVELLESLDPEGVISNFIRKRGKGMHHIAFYTDNLEEEMNRLSAEGFTFIHARPKDGADNKEICFLHPSTTEGVLVELCQEKQS